MKRRLADDMVEKADKVCLDHEEKELLGGNAKECGAKHSIGRICPDPIANQVRIPRYCRDDCDLLRYISIRANGGPGDGD